MQSASEAVSGRDPARMIGLESSSINLVTDSWDVTDLLRRVRVLCLGVEGDI